MSRGRVHLLSLPNVQAHQRFDLDGFQTMNRRFCTVLKRLGYEVLLYAGDETDYECDELITTITEAERSGIVGKELYQHANIHHDNPLWKLATPRMIAEIGKRKQPRDLICTIAGGSMAHVSMAHPDLMTVEYSIGYVGTFAKYRVYQSHAWMHLNYGAQGMGESGGRFFDTVIPGFFDVSKFPENRPEDYVCYVGRFTPKKGLGIVCEAARLAGVPLKLIGHGDASLITYGENLGAVNEATRNEVMSKARALICPTLYVEPFGCISPEAQLCGTPVISTDFGGFTESVEHGLSGFRCHLLGEFVRAISDCEHLDRGAIRARAQSLYSIEAAVPQYGAYFDRLNTLWEKGWHTL